MNFEIPQFLIYLVSWLAFIGGVWGIFDRAEKKASDDVRNRVSGWIRKLKLPNNQRWPNAFIQIFDSLFGDRHFTAHCFFRSSIASMFFTLIFFILWMAIRPNEFESLFAQGWFIAIFGPLLFALIFNIIPDYVSLLETRLILKRMAETHSLSVIALLIVIDAILTTALIVFVFFLIFFVIGDRTLSYIYDELVRAFLLEAEEGFMSMGIYVYSTYLTSLWLWLYSLSGGLVRALGASGISLKKFLDIDKHPLRSLGFVSMMLVTIAYLLLPFACDKSYINLRSTPATLSEGDVKTMIIEKGFYDLNKNKSGAGLPNNYKTLAGGKVILDKSTGLMWQHSGSLDCITFENAQKDIVELNLEIFAGFDDWRLPTLEEAMSLMKPVKTDSGHISTLFDLTLSGTWTADRQSESAFFWGVHFYGGFCFDVIYVMPGVDDTRYVRAVRSAQKP